MNKHLITFWLILHKLKGAVTIMEKTQDKLYLKLDKRTERTERLSQSNNIILHDVIEEMKWIFDSDSEIITNGGLKLKYNPYSKIFTITSNTSYKGKVDIGVFTDVEKAVRFFNNNLSQK